MTPPSDIGGGLGRRPRPGAPVPKPPRIPDIPKVPNPPDRPEPQITSVEELLDFAGRTVSSGRPVLDAITASGVLSPDLHRKLDSQRPATVLTAHQAERLAALASAAGPVNFRVGRTVAFADVELPDGDYDVTVALRLSAVSEVLAALYDGYTVPHEISAAKASLVFGVASLRETFTGVPDGDDIETGVLHLDPSPSLFAASDRRVAVLRLPFTLDVDRVSAGGERSTVGTLTGVLQQGVTAVPVVVQDRVRLRLDIADRRDGIETFVVGSSSHLQPRSADALRTFADTAAVLLGVQIAGSLRRFGDEWSICPEIVLPVGAGVPLRIQRVDARFSGADEDGLLLVGVLIGTTDEPEDGVGDPERLRVPAMPDGASWHVRVHEALVCEATRRAFESGELQREVERLQEDIDQLADSEVRVEGASAEVERDVLRLRLKLRVVNACTFVDLDMTVTGAIQFAEVFDGRLKIETTRSVNLDNTDAFLCGIQGFILLLLSLVFPPLTVYLLIKGVKIISALGDETSVFDVTGVFDPRKPIPGTEAMPKAEVLQADIAADAILANGALTLRPDDVNTYVYVKVLEGDGGETKAVQGIDVRVLDQDVPTPPGDEVQVPEGSLVINQKRILRTTHEYRPPSGDQALASARTDDDGRVRFVLSPRELVTTQGAIVTTKTTERLDIDPGPGGVGHDLPGRFDPNRPTVPRDPDGPAIERHTSRRTVRERRPDVYFLLTMPDGEVIDTRDIDGFFPDLRDRHLGTANDPLTFVVDRQLRAKGPTKVVVSPR